MTQTKDDQQSVRELIAKIKAACGDGEAVFRGEPRKYADPVLSGIYRKHKEIFNEHYQSIDLEKEIVSKARDAVFSEDTPTVDILTDLRHFGGDTALVDFSSNPLVALFFACNGDQKEDGCVFVLPTGKLETIGSGGIHSENRGSDAALVSAARTPQSRTRVDAQSSVFVHVPGKKVEGFKRIPVPRAMKSACLYHLKRFHDIRQETMYNDLIGHIQNELNFRTAETAFYGGLAKQADNNHRKAIKYYDEAIRLRPEFPNAFNNRGNAKCAFDDHAGAIGDYDEAIRLRPRNPEALINRGNAKCALDDHAGAIRDYDEAIRLRPEFPKAFYNRGTAKGILGDHAGAIGDYDEAIRLRPEYPEAFYNRGRVKSILGDHAEALGDYDEAIRLRPRNPEALINRGNAKGILGDYTGAIKDYDEAIRLRPQDPEALINRGNAKCALDDHTEAIGDYDEAIRLRPEYPDAFNNRGIAKGILGNMEDARTDLETALALAQEQDDGRVAAAAADALGELAGER